MSGALAINSASATSIFSAPFLILLDTFARPVLAELVSSVEAILRDAPILAIRLQRISGKYLADKRF
jgi:hypothetical protein